MDESTLESYYHALTWIENLPSGRIFEASELYAVVLDKGFLDNVRDRKALCNLSLGRCHQSGLIVKIGYQRWQRA
jgi:hypothetical protein